LWWFEKLMIEGQEQTAAAAYAIKCMKAYNDLDQGFIKKEHEFIN